MKNWLKIKYSLFIIFSIIVLYIGMLMYSFAGKYTNPRKIVPRDITPELAKITNFLDKAEMPEDKETAESIKDKVQDVMDAWKESQELVNSRKIKIFIFKKMPMANWKDSNKGIQYHFSFWSDKGEIRQCTKSTQSNNKINFWYNLRFDEEQNLSGYRSIQDNFIYFYPSGSIETVHFIMSNGKQYLIRWTEDGKIIRQSIYER